MPLDRQIQHKILLALQDVYPDSLLVSALPNFANNRSYMANLFYLQEYELIEGGDIREPGQCRSMVDAQITRRGLDLLADDGGLAAILGLMTVKIDHKEFFAAVEKGLNKSEMTALEKNDLKTLLGNFDENSLKALLLDFLEEGIHSNTNNLHETLRKF